MLAINIRFIVSAKLELTTCARVSRKSMLVIVSIVVLVLRAVMLTGQLAFRIGFHLVVSATPRRQRYELSKTVWTRGYRK